MNIIDNSAIRPCTSCQVCSAVCNSMAIDIRLNEDGFYRPYVDADKCTGCGLCTKVCPRFDDEIRITPKESLDGLKLYAASAKDIDVVRSTTSGGISDLLAHHLLSEDYNIIGVVYDKELNNAVHRVADKKDEVSQFRGSKYIQPYSADAFRTMVKNCRNEKFAVFGLPCQIYAISKYLELIKKRENCFLVDLCCHGCPSMNLWKKVSDGIKHETGVESFDNVLWRSKLRGWGTFVLEVQKGGKRIYNSTPLHDEFFELFFCNQVLNESCNTCKFRGTLEYTDIRLGDFWGPDFRKTFRGMSSVSIATVQGQEIYDKISTLLVSREMPIESFLPYQSWGHEYKVDSSLREQLLSKLKDDYTIISDIVGILPSHKTTAYKLKTIIKQLFNHLPIRFQILIRNS